MSNDRLSTLLEEYAQLEKQMEDPSIHSDQARVRRVGRRFAELAPLHAAHAELEAARADLVAARELAAEDPAFASEVEAVAATLAPLEEKLGEMLIPRDPSDAKDVIIEIKAGEGGGDRLDLGREGRVLGREFPGRGQVGTGRLELGVRGGERGQLGETPADPAHQRLVGVDGRVLHLLLQRGVLVEKGAQPIGAHGSP